MPPEKLRVLIADDDEGDRKQITRVLKQAGISCECVETVNAEDAVAACAEGVVDCAFVDYKMPGRDGLYGIAALHERFPYMAIIMVTGHGDEEIAAEAMKLGASDYIPKAQIHARSVKRAIDSALGKAALRRQVAQQRNELENFASVLVHDLAGPLTAMRGYAGIIESELRPESIDRDSVAGHAHSLVGAIERMGALVGTLHEYTKVDAKVTFEPVDMNQVMENTMSNLQQVIEKRGARVTHGELPAVTGNAPQLAQLLQNLIGNSIKYCEAAQPTVEVTANSDGEGMWRFAVKDNGIGISKEYYQQVFEPFKRLHGRGKYEGTGLGLATCKKIVERHGGAIWCESAPNDGTTLFFNLPSVPG